jgi:hypothetical protein
MDMKDFQEAVKTAVREELKNFEEDAETKKKREEEESEKSYKQYCEHRKRFEEEEKKETKKKKDDDDDDDDDMDFDDEWDDDDDDDEKDNDDNTHISKDGKKEKVETSTSKSFREFVKNAPRGTKIQFYDGEVMIDGDGKLQVLSQDIPDFMKSRTKDYSEAVQNFGSQFSEYEKAFSEMNPELKPEEIRSKAAKAFAERNRK